MRGDQQGSAGSFITSARLDSHETVLDQIHPADRITRANFVEQFDQRDGIEFHAVDGDRNSLREANLHFFFMVGRILRGTGELPGGG